MVGWYLRCAERRYWSRDVEWFVFLKFSSCWIDLNWKLTLTFWFADQQLLTLMFFALHDSCIISGCGSFGKWRNGAECSSTTSPGHGVCRWGRSSWSFRGQQTIQGHWTHRAESSWREDQSLSYFGHPKVNGSAELLCGECWRPRHVHSIWILLEQWEESKELVLGWRSWKRWATAW